MKLSIQQGDMKFSLELDPCYASDDKESVKELIAFIKKAMFNTATPAPAAKVLQQTRPSQPERTTFHVRERIPNNVVNLDDLTIKQAVTKSALVRCPRCGQAHALILRDGHTLYVMRRNFVEDEFVIVTNFDDLDTKMTDAYTLSDSNTTPQTKLKFFHKLQGMMPCEEKDFNVDNDTEIFCPVCCKSSSFHYWKDAYENKEKYFEHQYVCNVCGGECDIDMDKEGNNGHLVVCSDCGHKWIKRQA